MIAIYALLFPIFFTPVILFLSLASPKIRAGFKQKFGKYDFKIKEKTLWIHAVSVGEIAAISDFIRKNATDKKIVLTTSTPQGRDFALSKLSKYCAKICYFPYDYKFAIKNAIEAINPKVIMIVETEIWPNFVYEAKKANIPVVIANGRISDSTFKSYKKISFFLGGVFKNFHAILAQSEDDAKRFIKIGAKPNIVKNMGNLKFDTAPQNLQTRAELEKTYNKGELKVIVAGSTHKGEEGIVLNSFARLRNKDVNLRLIIAPRHLERLGEVEGLIKKTKLKYSLKTMGADLASSEVILLDTTGELANLYSIADVAFLGGSLNETGGHNPLEATVWGVPVLSGPNIRNFRVIYRELIKNGCAKIINNAFELGDEFKRILENKQLYGKNCTQTIEQNRGAAKNLENCIKELYGN